MGIKLSDYIKNPEDAISEEEWAELYKRAEIDSDYKEEIFPKNSLIKSSTDELKEEE